MERHALRYGAQIRHVLSFPRCDLMPRRFVDGASVPALVKVLGDKRETGHHVVSDDVGPDGADTSLEFDLVDVIHKIYFFDC